jgi:hypothetical protein
LPHTDLLTGVAGAMLLAALSGHHARKIPPDSSGATHTLVFAGF